MYKYIICAIFLLNLAAQASASLPLCPPNQVWDNCGTACPPTCKNPNPLICTANCVVGCRCMDGYYTVREGGSISCILPSQCPTPCSGGQKWNSCGTACPPTCSNPNPICTKQCVPGCQCPRRKPIFFKGKCIKQKRCKKCPRGQRWNDCGTACPLTCKDPKPGPCILICKPGCECKKGVQLPVRGTDDFFCVKPKKCPPKGRCKGDMVWNECGSACTPTCANPNPICTLQCVARCECPHGQVWHKRKCIEKSECN